MFSHEHFDFPSTGHPADAHLDALDPYHDALFDSYIDSSHVDQSFCSDFACCGQKLPDLHRLLEHFEDEHVLPLAAAAADARPLFSSPSPVYAQLRPAALAPYASYILSYPQPDPPLQCHSISTSTSVAAAAFGPASRALPSLLQFAPGGPPIHPPDLAHATHAHRPFSPASSATSAQSSPGPAEPVCLPPSLLSFRPSPPARERSRRRDRRRRARDTSDTDVDVVTDETDENDDEGEDADDNEDARPARVAKLSVGLGGSLGPHRRRAKTARKAQKEARVPPSPLTFAARRPTAERERERERPPKRRDGREKAFRCPHTGCTKSYLNPNGLKYHLEKGTCTNTDVRGRDPLPAPAPAPAPASASASALVALPCSLHPTAAAVPETATPARSEPGRPPPAQAAAVVTEGDPARLEVAQGRA